MKVKFKLHDNPEPFAGLNIEYIIRVQLSPPVSKPQLRRSIARKLGEDRDNIDLIGTL